MLITGEMNDSADDMSTSITSFIAADDDHGLYVNYY